MIVRLPKQRQRGGVDVLFFIHIICAYIFTTHTSISDECERLFLVVLGVCSEWGNIVGSTFPVYICPRSVQESQACLVTWRVPHVRPACGRYKKACEGCRMVARKQA